MSVVDQSAFRKALGAFVTGVTVVTATSESGDAGVTANSFNSVSLDPPLVLWSLNKSSSSRRIFLEAGGFVIHILAEDQQALSARFARSGPDRFAGLEFKRGFAAAPLLEGCAARLQCRLVSKHDGGDHEILVGEVVDYEHSVRPPLVFHGGKYTSVTVQSAAEAARDQPVADGELMHLMSRAYHVLYAHERDDFEKRHLSEEAYKILRNLAVKDNQTETGLANKLASGGLELTQAGLQSLIGRGEIQRSKGHISLTECGRQTMVELAVVRMAIEETFFERFAREDVVILKAFLRRIIEKGKAIALSRR